MTTTTFIFEKRKLSPTNTALDAIYTVFRGEKPNYIGTVGRVQNVWIACTAAGETVPGFTSRKKAATFLSNKCGPFKSEVQQALKALEAELSSPQMQALLAEEI